MVVAEVRDDRLARVLRCRGKSYLDLLAQRAGDCASAPDAVVIPGDVEAVLRICAEEGIAVVPFGGGTSVVGGLAGLRGAYDALVSLDLGRLDRVLGVDAASLTAVFEPGIRLPEADRVLRGAGLTHGHVPQSYEWASVGGCVATRSAGQASTGHGRIDANVLGLDLVTPSGPPAHARHRGDRRGARPARAGGRLRRDARGHHPRRAARAPAAGFGAPRGLGIPVVRRGRGRAAPAGARRAGARHRAAVRRGGDAARPRAGGHRAGRPCAARGPLPARARLGAPHRPPPRGRFAAAALGRPAARRRAGPRVGEVPLRRPLPARRPARPRRARRDARDRHVVVEPRAPLRQRPPRARGRRTSAATSRTCTRPAPRCTSRSSPRRNPTRPRSGAPSSPARSTRSPLPAAR